MSAEKPSRHPQQVANEYGCARTVLDALHTYELTPRAAERVLTYAIDVVREREMNASNMQFSAALATLDE